MQCCPLTAKKNDVGKHKTGIIEMLRPFAAAGMLVVSFRGRILVSLRMFRTERQYF